MTALTDRTSARAAYPELHLFIGGAWVARGQREASDVIDPATLEMLGQVPHASDADLTAAIGAAQAAFAGWRATPALERSRILRRAADWLRERRDQWAALITLELGKPIAQSRIETETACELFEWAAEEARRLYDRQIPARLAGMRLTAVSEPVGLVGAISGWNAPAITPARKISGALAAGCPIVLKPSEATPASALFIAQAFEAAGLPAGVLNIVFGDPPLIGTRLATDPAIRMLTFTGGTAIGKELAGLASGTVKRLVLELGGHAPVLVFADCDIPAVAAAAAAAKFRNAGQVCTSPTRFLIEDSAFDAFAEGFERTMLALRVGDPFDPATEVGPLQNARRVAGVGALVSDAVCRGAYVAQGQAPQTAGFWHGPTLLRDVSADARILHEEPFGPVAVLSRFTGTDAAIAEANRLSFGLAAYAFTSDLARAERLSREVEAGSLAINHWAASFPETPFGGVKESGLGLEGGSEGLAAFRQTRFVSVKA
jgi:succinate-semialdehyde dehydrogenase/glutarate-semialdehyde dehydrogenase